ncbi:SDR family NAD(P)-dependent oxidoreductase [Lentzea chajnantorensis]
MRLAVVSGGTRGIGLALSRRLTKLGFEVVALYRSDAAAAEASGLRTYQVDVADPDAVAVVADKIGPISVLVNNAGVNIDRPFLEMSVQDWKTVVDTNLSGAFYLTRAFVPMMDDGTVINVGATTGMRARANGANYCAAKAGLLHLTKCLALELAPKIRVNCLIPGMTETDELVTRFRLDDPVARAQVISEIPVGRMGTVEDVADGLEFLVNGTYVTGQKLIVDGGQWMW